MQKILWIWLFRAFVIVLIFFQPYRRNTDERFERVMYMRDMRVNGNVYKGNVSWIKDPARHFSERFVSFKGLESIPDENKA